MKPLMNLDEIDNYEEREHAAFKSKTFSVGDKIGAQNLAYRMTILEPSGKVCPFHSHRIIEEMFLILEGSGTLRYGDKEYAIKKHDIISCPPGGPEVAHQIINTSDAELKYLSLSTNESVDICQYPDSNKTLSFSGKMPNFDFMHISKLEDAVGYYEGEE